MEDYKSRTAVYLRKSRNDNPDETVDETLERHLNILTEFAIKNNITIIKIYKEVISGDGLFIRPQMIALLNDIEQGLYTAVLCVDIDRLGRSSMKDSGIIIETLKENECFIITPEKTYNPEDEADEFTVEMKSFFARQEWKSIRKRLMRGEIETIKAGGHTGEPPYAYKRTWINKMPTLEIIPEKAEIVKMIYNMFVIDGYGSYTISNRLNSMGCLAPGGGLFSRSSVRMILSNPIYTGKIVWNRMKRVKKKNPTDKFKEIANPPEKWIEAKGLHEAIIDDDLWNKAQEIRASRSHPPSYKGIVKNQFSGLCICANCGKTMQRQSNKSKGTPRLICTTTSCMPGIPIGWLEEHLKILIQTELEQLKLNRNTQLKKEDGEKENQLKAIEKQIKTISAQRDKLHDFLEQGIYDTDTFMKRQSTLIDKQNEYEKQASELRHEMTIDSHKISADAAIPTIEELLKTWDDMQPWDLNQMLKTIINKITYRRIGCTFKNGPDLHLEIDWKFQK